MSVLSITTLKQNIAAYKLLIQSGSITPDFEGKMLEDITDTLNSSISKTSNLIYQNAVATVGDLTITYPTPSVGWASMVTGVGYIYAWNGTAWVNTGLKAFSEDVVSKSDIGYDFNVLLSPNNAFDTGITPPGAKIWENIFDLTNVEFDGFYISFKRNSGTSPVKVYLHTGNVFTLLETLEVALSNEVQRFKVTANIPVGSRVAISGNIGFSGNGVGMTGYNDVDYSVTDTLYTNEFLYSIEYFGTQQSEKRNIYKRTDVLESKSNTIIGDDNFMSPTIYESITSKLINITNYDNSPVSFESFIWFNQSCVAPKDCVVSYIKGCFEAGTSSIFVLNKEQNLLRKIADASVITGVNEFNVNIVVLEGEMVCMTGLRWTVTSGICSYKFTRDGLNVSSKVTDVVEFGLSVRFSESYKNLNDMQLFAQQIAANAESLNSLKKGYVVLHDELSDWLLNGFLYSDNKLSSTTNNSYCHLRKKYNSDDRFIRFDVQLSSNSVVKFPCAYGSITGGEGASCFAVDLLAKNLIIYSVGDGTDTQYSSIGYTDTELVSVSIPDDCVVGDEYIVEITKKGIKSSILLINKTSGNSVVAEHTGWAAGRQNENYYVKLVSGGITIHMAQVLSFHSPDVVFVGDSQTEGVYVADRTQRYAELYKTNNPEQKIVISARGGDTINGILEKFETEFNIYKPKKMSVLIGANGGNTATNLRLLKSKCDAINCKLYLHRLVCQQAGDLHLDDNEIISELGYEGARFDVATAKDYYPLVDGEHASPRYNAALYGDSGLHPNVAGNIKMYQRLKIDCESLNYVNK